MATRSVSFAVVDATDPKTPVTGDAANLTLSVITDNVAVPYAGAVTELTPGEYGIEVEETGAMQSVVGSTSTPNAIVIPARWQNAPAVGAHVVTLTVVDGDGNPVGSCPVRVANAGGQLLGYGLTNSATGVVVFNLDAGDYIVTLGPLSDYSPANPYTLTVAGDTTADLTVTAISLPTPSSASCYALYNTETDEQDLAFGASGITVQVIDLSEAGRVDATNNRFRSIMGRSASTDANGQWSLDIPIQAFTACAKLTLRRTWTDAGEETQSEDWVCVLAAPSSGTQVCWADLSPVRA